MKILTRGVALSLLGMLTLGFMLGCAQRDVKKTTVRERQEETQYEEQRPGEMQVE
ncbi:hypothetical protein RAS1_02170 [Phycisphaerae bacterium RAS1]|nr:hypothetical protein RAS1_02170 [Phycisphaerae bacterium RAS1]